MESQGARSGPGVGTLSAPYVSCEPWDTKEGLLMSACALKLLSIKFAFISTYLQTPGIADS